MEGKDLTSHKQSLDYIKSLGFKTVPDYKLVSSTVEIIQCIENIGEKKEADIKANYESGILTITFPKEDILKNEKQNIIIK